MECDDKETPQENKKLLNEIKESSASQKIGDTNETITEPKQFVIPPLQLPLTTTATTTIQTNTSSIKSTSSLSTADSTNKSAKVGRMNEPPPSPLNQYLLSQLKQRNINGLSEGFKLPELKVPGGSSANKTFNIPMLSRLHIGKDASPDNQIQKGLQNLSIKDTAVTDQQKEKIILTSPPRASITRTNSTDDSNLIDLTAALIINPGTMGSNQLAATERKRAEDFAKAQNASTFKIPHIHCDRMSVRMNKYNEFREEVCVMDVKNIKFKHNLAKPTALGEALSATDKCLNTRLFPCAATAQEKINLKLYKREDYGTVIQRFRFDTKSPDDLVKESLVKCQRISHT